MQTLGVGIIGYGFMGKVHAYDYLSPPIYYEPMPVRTKLVGVADAVPERARLAVEQAGFEFSTTDWHELVARMDPNYLEGYDLRAAEGPLGGSRSWGKIACVQHYEKPGGFSGPKFSGGWIRVHLHSLYNFLEAIATGKPPRPSLLDGLNLQRLLAAAEQSARTHTWQSLSGGAANA